MTTLPNRTATAVLVVDAQNAALRDTHRRAEVVAAIGRLADRARAAGAPVVWVRHGDEQMPVGSEAWQIVPELAPAPGEPLVGKGWADSFEASSLEEELAARAVGRLLVAGAQTDVCIRSTLHGALVRGYDTVLVSDAHTCSDETALGAPAPELVIAHTNLYWSGQHAPGRQGGTVTADRAGFGAVPAP
ncbi:isochorismatase family protein [Kitasatospora viridis]|uniref:Nicotinamidase-related amidase n=1 Tax=Kitasatospora viridis TaxID=281105 RepID=A0A561UQ62_9ACTN|nr:isochorismatase family protein [Kitasatospora viridis]TWG01500.1 nicotinamidase-related amidase [Kitasatospora viridis]